MRPSSAAWSGRARAGCCCTPCPSETLLRAAGVVKVVEQTWRLDTEADREQLCPDRERPRIEPGQVQRRPGREAWFIARGRYEHLMVARTQISTATGPGRMPWWPGSVLAAYRGLARCSHLGRGVTGRPGGPRRPPRASGHRAAARRRWRRPGVVHARRTAIRASPGRPPAAPRRGCGCPRRRPGRHRHPGPPAPLTASTPPSWSPWPRPAGPSRGSTVALAGQPAVDHGPPAAAAQPETGGTGEPERQP